jgi:hypothetical protein
MKNTAEMGSGHIIYVPSFLKILSAIQKLTQTHNMEISQAYFHF